MGQGARRSVLALLAFMGLQGADFLPWHELLREGNRPAGPEEAHVPEEAAAGLLMTYCRGCHSSGRTKVDLDGFPDAQAIRRDRGDWEKVAQKLRTGEMPPAGSPQPSLGERKYLIHWIEQAVLQDSSGPSE